jgi:hypothetical protein
MGPSACAFTVVAGVTFAVGLGVNAWLAPHYLAPFTAGSGLLLQAIRHLRVAAPEGHPIGLFLVRTVPVLCLALVAVRLCGVPLKLVGPWPTIWRGPAQGLGTARASTLASWSYPGQNSPSSTAPVHDFMDEWVYNAASIDRSKIVWAREMDSHSNAELLRYFSDRTVWLVEPDYTPPKVSLYPTALTSVVSVPPR